MASLSGLWRKKEEKKEEKKVRIHFITDNFKRLTFDVEDDDCIWLHSGEALVIQGKEGNVKKKMLASDDTGGYKVHRFWHHDSHTPQDFAPALSWAKRGYHQIIYTNRVDDNSWTRLGTNITILPIPDIVDPDLCAEYQKDEWQFGIVKGAKQSVLCVDWDFYLIKDLPNDSTKIGRAHV